MAIKQPVRTIEDAFASSCKKNGIGVQRRKHSRVSMPIRDENGDVLILSGDLSIKKKEPIKSTLQKEHTSKIFSPHISEDKKKIGKKKTRAKVLVKA
ncbi:MAG: hypothetical protein NC302_06575 [Bacteroidales bacterium]|nr:hypothetical protein [Bacteroidales bacterium]MCM1415224.1 hypothetical protein [bacterium]MCM1423782.1 hypothetical protein [bacterium]